jgi:acetylornithine deacetylase/succinyl-diaminopimelate desuccinylase-like protein
MGETISRAQIQIEELIQREEIDASVEIMEYQGFSYEGHEFQVREAFHSWALDEDDPLIEAMAQTAASVLNRAIPIGYWSFSTDGVFTVNEARIPTIGFGPGDPDLSHMVDEYVPVQAVALAAHIYALFAMRMLSTG